MKRLAEYILVVICSCVFSASAFADTAFPSWDWQLTEPFDLSRDVKVMDLEPASVTTKDIARLKARGVFTICYVSVGTIENFRSDFLQFPENVIGNIYGDWPDENFLDIRQMDILLPLMRKRFHKCRKLGFDAIEADNMDVYENDSGFPITQDDNVKYLRALADIARDMGLQIAQKNVPELSPLLIDKFDFVISEGCFHNNWCEQLSLYRAAGKNIYNAEYTDTDVNWNDACEYAYTSNNMYQGVSYLSMILKDRELTKQLDTCPE